MKEKEHMRVKKHIVVFCWTDETSSEILASELDQGSV